MIHFRVSKIDFIFYRTIVCLKEKKCTIDETKDKHSYTKV